MRPRRKTFVAARVEPREARSWLAEAHRRDLSLAQLIRCAVRELLAANAPRPPSESSNP